MRVSCDRANEISLIRIKLAERSVAQAAETIVKCGDCPIRHRAVCARCETDELDVDRSVGRTGQFSRGEGPAG